VEDLFTYDHAGWAPIHYVAFHGHYAAVEAIVSGVPQLVDFRTADQFKVTPLMLAAMGNQLDIVRLLLQHGASIKMVDRLCQLLCASLSASFAASSVFTIRTVKYKSMQKRQEKEKCLTSTCNTFLTIQSNSCTFSNCK